MIGRYLFRRDSSLFDMGVCSFATGLLFTMGLGWCMGALVLGGVLSTIGDTWLRRKEGRGT